MLLTLTVWCLCFGLVAADCKCDCKDCECQCKNGATCNQITDKDYTCQCKPGFYGKHCQLNPCSSNPCKNYGTCTYSGYKYSCQCFPKTTGANCETSEWISKPNRRTSYHVVDDKWSYDDCKQKCKALGTDVISLDDEDEMGYLGIKNKYYDNRYKDYEQLKTFRKKLETNPFWITNDKCRTLKANLEDEKDCETDKNKCVCEKEEPVTTIFGDLCHWPITESSGEVHNECVLRKDRWWCAVDGVYDDIKNNIGFCAPYDRKGDDKLFYICDWLPEYGTAEYATSYGGGVRDLETTLQLCREVCILYQGCYYIQYIEENDEKERCYMNDTDKLKGNEAKGLEGNEKEAKKVLIYRIIDKCPTDSCAGNDSICGDHGTCVDHIHLDDYHCSCDPGFEGDKCETDIDYCASNPCSNGTTCEDLAEGYKCHSDADAGAMAAAIGSSIGAILLVAVAIAVFMLYKKKKTPKDDEDDEDEDEDEKEEDEEKAKESSDESD